MNSSRLEAGTVSVALHRMAVAMLEARAKSTAALQIPWSEKTPPTCGAPGQRWEANWEVAVFRRSWKGTRPVCPIGCDPSTNLRSSRRRFR